MNEEIIVPRSSAHVKVSQQGSGKARDSNPGGLVPESVLLVKMLYRLLKQTALDTDFAFLELSSKWERSVSNK